MEVDCVFVEVGRGEVGASAEPPCEKFSGGGGNFKVAVVGVGGGCMWVSRVDNEAESGCVEREAAVLVFGKRNGCVVCAHLFHCCGGKSAVDVDAYERRWTREYARFALPWVFVSASSAAVISSCSPQTNSAILWRIVDMMALRPGY